MRNIDYKTLLYFLIGVVIGGMFSFFTTDHSYIQVKIDDGYMYYNDFKFKVEYVGLKKESE